MTVISLVFLLLCGTAVQALLPAPYWLGQATAPVMAALVIYAALYRGGAVMMAMALLAGLFQDSLTMIPLGYSSFLFMAGAMILDRYRDIIVLHSAFTHLALTALLHAVATFVLSLLLLNDGLIAWLPLQLLLKLPGSLALGMVTGPLVIGAALALEEKLGLVPSHAESSYGTKRNIYGLG